MYMITLFCACLVLFLVIYFYYYEKFTNKEKNKYELRILFNFPIKT